MELIDRKRIVNGKYPKFSTGLDFGAPLVGVDVTKSKPLSPAFDINQKYPKGIPTAKPSTGGLDLGEIAGAVIPYAQAGLAVANGVADFIGGLNSQHTVNELDSMAGTSESSVGDGYGYTYQNAVDTDQAMSDYMSGGGLIGKLGKLFGKGKERERIRKQQELAAIKQDFGRSGAVTDMMQDEYAEQYGNLNTQKLFSALNGKDAVETATGKTKGILNAWVNKGEWIWDGEDGLNYVDHGPNDTAKAYLRGKDTVFTTKHGIADMVPYAAMTGQLPELAQYQKQLHMMGYKNGKDKMPGFKGGKISWGSNFWPAAFGTAASIGQYLDARSLDINTPDSYASNPLERPALSVLRGLRIDPEQAIREMHNESRRGQYRRNMLGGTSGALRYLANVADYNNMYANIGKMINDIQAQNNAYQSQWATQALSSGENTARRRMNAKQWNEDYVAKSHAARLQGMLMGLYNALNQLDQYTSNEFNRKQFNDMMDMYRQDLKLRKDELFGANMRPRLQFGPSITGVNLPVG